MKSSGLIKAITALFVCAVVVASLCIISLSFDYVKFKDEYWECLIKDPELEDEFAQDYPHKLTTSLSLSLNGENGKASATVKNNLLVFSSGAEVIVQLYCSDHYADRYFEMELVEEKRIENLAVGKSISIEAPIDGEKFWLARMKFKIYGIWSTRDTGAYPISKSGEILLIYR